MSAYSSLARFYDCLTKDVPYSVFADFYEKLFHRYGLQVKTILDLGCGTGTMTRLLAERGYDMLGVDASPDMLSVAAQKKARRSCEPVYICQRMEKLDLYGTVDAVICSLDGINYVRPAKLAEVFRRVKLFLEPGGIFIFDILSPLRLKNMDGSVFIDETPDVLCVWRAAYNRRGRSCTYGIELFTRSGELWSRNTEEHTEYAHDPQKLAVMLEREGFINILRAGKDRIFFAAQKPLGTIR